MNVAVSSLEIDGKLYSDDRAKATLLSSHFAFVFARESLDTIPTKDTTSYPTSDCIKITVGGVTNLLNEINVYKACGPDGIPSRLLKETANCAASMLTLIYSASLKQGKVPDNWKKALVIPVFKKGARTCTTNYRPITLTCVSCKIFEHIVHSHIFKHLNNYDILCDQQHGFRKNRSCESQLIGTVNDLATYLNPESRLMLSLLV